MIAPPESLVALFKPWSDFYGHSKLAETIVTFLHVGGLLLAGGLAIAADRGTLRAMNHPETERGHYARELAATHRWVLTGLAVVVVSGLALLASDFETFWGSWIYWLKMLLVIVLLFNGWQMTKAEKTAAWGTLHRTAKTSLGLWFTITALGLALVNFS